MLFVTGGNPLLTMARSDRLRDAFQSLELLVVVLDIFPSETASIADVVLPCTSPLERPDLPFVFPLLLGLQSRALQATRGRSSRLRARRGGDEASIYLELARACGVSLFGASPVQLAFEAAKRASGEASFLRSGYSTSSCAPRDNLRFGSSWDTACAVLPIAPGASSESGW